MILYLLDFTSLPGSVPTELLCIQGAKPGPGETPPHLPSLVGHHSEGSRVTWPGMSWVQGLDGLERQGWRGAGVRLGRATWPDLGWSTWSIGRGGWGSPVRCLGLPWPASALRVPVNLLKMVKNAVVYLVKMTHSIFFCCFCCRKPEGKKSKLPLPWPWNAMFHLSWS